MKLRSNVHADRYVGALLLPISYIGVGANSQAAFYGRILVDLEGHGLGWWILPEIAALRGSLRLSHGESEGILLHRSNLSGYGLWLRSVLAV